MSSPRDRDPFDDRPDDGSAWREPTHLGGEGATPAPDDTPVEHSRPAAPPAPDAQRQGLFGPRRPRTPGAVEEVFAYQGDLVGAQSWALQHGWTISDGTGPEDAVLAQLVASAPVRAHRDHVPAGVMRGRYGTLDLVAFDVVYTSGRYRVPEYAITAAPLLGHVPTLRLSPARLWKHRTGGLVPVPSGDPAFDARWQLLATEDGPQARALVGDPAVRGMLLGTDDGDEFWTDAGHLAAVRPDGHRPQLIEHHARLLAAMVPAFAAGH
jgi:hypothetical protein